MTELKHIIPTRLHESDDAGMVHESDDWPVLKMAPIERRGIECIEKVQGVEDIA